MIQCLKTSWAGVTYVILDMSIADWRNIAAWAWAVVTRRRLSSLIATTKSPTQSRPSLATASFALTDRTIQPLTAPSTASTERPTSSRDIKDMHRLSTYMYLVYTPIHTGWARKNVALYICPYLHQLLIDFQNSFTGTLCRQFAIMCLLYIPPHHKFISTLHCEISMKYAYIMIIINKHFCKIGKKHFRPTLQGHYITCSNVHVR